MARELGMGVMPWSPLARGVLTGKYKRADHGKHQASRGERTTASLTPKAYDLIEELERVAAELGTTPARVALAWVAGRPGVSSTIIGARTLEQLEDNLAAAEIALPAACAARLDALSTPTLPFPVSMTAILSAIVNGGTRINGVHAPAWPATPATDDERW